MVVEAGQGSIEADVATASAWAALVAAMLLAAALWWLYFDSVAEINLRVLELSGGSPTMARAIFAVGHMLPAFALLITAAGIGLLLEEDPPRIADWLACIGIGMYLAGTRAISSGARWLPGILRVLLLVATFQLARLAPQLSPYAYLWLLTGWVLLCAVVTTHVGPRRGAGPRALPRRRPPRALAEEMPARDVERAQQRGRAVAAPPRDGEVDAWRGARRRAGGTRLRRS